MEYDASLDRAYDTLPELSIDDDRLDVPDPALETDGAFTRFTNLSRVADALNRDPEHLHRNVQQELGTAGTLEDGRGRYNGSFTRRDFESAVDDYVAEYVTCSECGLPDTRLVRENRTAMLRCDACGAFRPVAKRPKRARNERDPDDIVTGETYEVKITDTGRKGDGVAERGKYTIFVTGAQEGDVLEIYVEHVDGTLAFARPAQ